MVHECIYIGVTGGTLTKIAVRRSTTSRGKRINFVDNVLQLDPGNGIDFPFRLGCIAINRLGQHSGRQVAALYKAFGDTMRDPQFIKAAKQANMYYNPMGGDEPQRVVGEIVSPSERIPAMGNDAIALKDAQRKAP